MRDPAKLFNILGEPKCEFLTKKRKDVGIKSCNDPNIFIECSNRMDDVHQNIDDYNPNTDGKVLIVFDEIIEEVMSNKKFQTIIKELFIRCRKANISRVFITDLIFCSKRC